MGIRRATAFPVKSVQKHIFFSLSHLSEVLVLPACQHLSRLCLSPAPSLDFEPLRAGLVFLEADRVGGPCEMLGASFHGDVVACNRELVLGAWVPRKASHIPPLLTPRVCWAALPASGLNFFRMGTVAHGRGPCKGENEELDLELIHSWGRTRGCAETKSVSSRLWMGV